MEFTPSSTSIEFDVKVLHQLNDCKKSFRLEDQQHFQVGKIERSPAVLKEMTLYLKTGLSQKPPHFTPKTL